jgi:hypothetical protein
MVVAALRSAGTDKRQRGEGRKVGGVRSWHGKKKGRKRGVVAMGGSLLEVA